MRTYENIWKRSHNDKVFGIIRKRNIRDADNWWNKSHQVLLVGVPCWKGETATPKREAL